MRASVEPQLLTLEGWVRTDGAVLLAYPAIGAIFILSVFLALLAILVRYVHVHIPVVSTYTFETLPVAFLLLRVTCSVAFEKTAFLHQSTSLVGQPHKPGVALILLLFKKSKCD